MIQEFYVWLMDGLILTGLLIMTIAIYGIIRMPDLYTRVHAASKALFLGVIPILISSMLLGDPAITGRSILVGMFLVLTTPVSAHAIVKAAYQKKEPMKAPDQLDESGYLTDL